MKLSHNNYSNTHILNHQSNIQSTQLCDWPWLLSECCWWRGLLVLSSSPPLSPPNCPLHQSLVQNNKSPWDQHLKEDWELCKPAEPTQVVQLEMNQSMLQSFKQQFKDLTNELMSEGKKPTEKGSWAWRWSNSIVYDLNLRFRLVGAWSMTCFVWLSAYCTTCINWIEQSIPLKKLNATSKWPWTSFINHVRVEISDQNSYVYSSQTK